MTSSGNALAQLALHAALADGTLSEPERQLLDGFVRGLPEPRPSIAAIESDLLARRCSVAELARPFAEPSQRQAAFEMCSAICAADGPASDAERWFLDELRRELGLDVETATATGQRVDSVVDTLPARTIQVGPPTFIPSPVATVVVDGAALDKTILNHALLAGGLELLPGTIAAMAILPVQMRLVYSIGKAHGVELDRGHIQEFLGVIGVGVASQMLERYAVKLVGGLAGMFLGGFGRGLAGQATESSMAFATTYAMGQAARQYYAGGRRLGAVELKSLFSGLLPQARGLQSGYQQQIHAQGDSLRGADIASLVRGI